MKILFACGGTGGHIFPAFSVAEEIKRRTPAAQIIYVCGKKDIENSIFKIVVNEKVVSVDSAPFKGALSLINPVFLVKLLKGLSQSFRLLRREKPDVVVGFGGYFSFPAILAAKALGIKTLVHEQNVIPGVANKFVARLVDGVALSFSETQKYLPACRNIRTTGNPIRASIERDCREEALTFFNFSKDKITILVLGGSQGAESINTVFLDALPLLPETVKAKIQVLHLCGKMPVEVAQEALRRSRIPGRVYSFFERMDLAYGACDFSVGRAGATFLAEIAAKKIPSVLIPYPFGSGHQLLNARVFSLENDAVIIEQKDLTADSLSRLLVDYAAKAPTRNGQRALTGQSRNSRALLADYIEEFL